MTGIPENTDPWVSVSWKRFVVLRHDVGPCFERTREVHLDWMFATGDTLGTWSTELITDFENSVAKRCLKLADHRLVYLDREGDLGGGRGSVQRMLAGEYTQLTSDSADVTFKAALRWGTESGVRRGLLEIGQWREEKVSDAEPILELRLSICR
jgi:hypothetical protein